MESNTKVSYIKVKVEDIGYEDFKSKEKPVFEVTEEGAEKEVNEQEALRELEEAYAKKTFNKEGYCMVPGLTENNVSDTSEGVAVDKLITKNANYEDLFDAETWKQLDPLAMTGGL